MDCEVILLKLKKKLSDNKDFGNLKKLDQLIATLSCPLYKKLTKVYQEIEESKKGLNDSYSLEKAIINLDIGCPDRLYNIITDNNYNLVSVSANFSKSDQKKFFNNAGLSVCESVKSDSSSSLYITEIGKKKSQISFSNDFHVGDHLICVNNVILDSITLKSLQIFDKGLTLKSLAILSLRILSSSLSDNSPPNLKSESFTDHDKLLKINFILGRKVSNVTASNEFDKKECGFISKFNASDRDYGKSSVENCEVKLKKMLASNDIPSSAYEQDENEHENGTSMLLRTSKRTKFIQSTPPPKLFPKPTKEVLEQYRIHKKVIKKNDYKPHLTVEQITFGKEHLDDPVLNSSSQASVRKVSHRNLDVVDSRQQNNMYNSTENMDRAFRTERSTYNDKNEKVYILRRNDMIRSASADHLYSQPRQSASPRVAFDDRIRTTYASNLNLRSPSPGMQQPRSTKLSFADEMKITDNWKRILGPGYDIIISPYSKPKSDSGLGIGIERTLETEPGSALKKSHHYVSSVDPSGPVGREGLIRAGDELLQVNDYRIFHESTSFVTDVLNNLPNDGHLSCARKCTHPGEGYHYQGYHVKSRQDIENEIMTRDRPMTQNSASPYNYNNIPENSYQRTYARPMRDNDDAPHLVNRNNYSGVSSPSRPKVQLIYDPAPGVLLNSHEVTRMSASPTNFSRIDSPPSRNQELYVRSRLSSPARINESNNYFINNTSRFWDDFQEEVILVRPKEGFGMDLVEVVDKENKTNQKFCIIDHLDSEGIVFQDRRLKTGDRIVQIDVNNDEKNDYNEGATANKTVKELIDTVKVGQTLRLTVQELLPHVNYNEVKNFYGIKTTSKSPSSNLNYSSPPTDERNTTASPLSDYSNYRLPEPNKVVVKKNQNETLGISLDYTDGGAYGYRINGILGGSSADRSFKSMPSWHPCPGRGDYLIEINDYNFCNLDSYTARSILNEIGEKSGTFVVSFRPGNRT